MPRIVACMKAYDFVEGRMSKVGDKISDELVEAILYSFIKYRTQALKELPAEQGAPLEGPQNIKEIFNNIKAELQDLAHKVGESFVQGMAKSFAENMPKFMVTRPVQAAEKTDSLLSLIPSRRTVLEMLLGEKNKKSLLANASTELGEEEEENPHLTEEIRAIEEELASINVSSHFAQDIQLYERCSWQAIMLQKRIWLYVFHMCNFFWNSVEAEKARNYDGIVKMLLWGAGAVFSFFELRKSASYRNVFSFYCYTPERFGLTIMKVAFVAMFVIQAGLFINYKDLSHSACCDKILEKLFISTIGATITTVGMLKLLKRGYMQRIEQRKTALADHKAKLHELLNQRIALLKKD